MAVESLLAEGAMCFDMLFECLCKSPRDRRMRSGDQEAAEIRQAAWLRQATERVLIWMGEAAIEPALKRMSARRYAKPRLGYDPVARVLAGLGVQVVPRLISSVNKRIPEDVAKLEDNAEVA